MEPPSVSEVSECISLLKRHRAAGPDDLPPALFKDGGRFLSQCPSSPFGFIWEKETVPDNWGKLEREALSLAGPAVQESGQNHYRIHRILTAVLTSVECTRMRIFNLEKPRTKVSVKILK
ncbi:hypothetical protein T265_01929 [Opisthorchis viverrini]|uniref:Uncharacterized protein n=1 Tax=Opisthorchis viverrini TaxID=6198 RepID=A0A075A172_OPIVI|nr:hypothetical protein T265_01929 [Opisthorchis viverrini]KER32002.1 hypothetical protein T265_01929 [Opisthorchis viverrini]